MAKRKIKLPTFARQVVNRQRAMARLDAVLSEASALAARGDLDAACRLLEQNLNRFAQYVEFRALLASLYGELGRYREAAEQARLAVDLAPGRPDMRLLAAVAYQAAGFYSLAAGERRIWLKTAPAGDLRQSMLEQEEVYGAGARDLIAHSGLSDIQAAEKAGHLLDEGRWALDHGRWQEALEHSRSASSVAPGWPAPRNNVTVSLIYLVRYREARDAARAVLGDLDADNIHALANLIQTSVILGETAEAAQAAQRLAALPPSADPVELKKQVQGLAWLDRDADIDRLLKTARRKRLEIGPDAYVHWGVAAANAGRRRDALAHLRRAEDAGVQSALLLTTLEGIEDKLPGPGILTRYPQTHFSDLLPPAALEAALGIVQRQEKTGIRDEIVWQQLRARYPQLPAALERMMLESPDGVEYGAQLLVIVLGSGAKETLLRFVRSQDGDDQSRMTVLRVMQQAGLIAKDEPVDMWLKGEQHQIQSRLWEISEDFEATYPEEAIDLYEQASAAQARQQHAEAIRLYRRALVIEPNMKEAYNNLGVALMNQGDPEGAQECIRKALAIDPLYPFPLVSTALQALYREGPAAAKAILAPLERVERWRPLDMVMYQKGLARIALEERDYESAKNSLEIVRQMNPEDRELNDLLTRVDALEMLSPSGGIFADWDESNRQRRRRKKLPQDPLLADCLGISSVGDMVGIGRVLRRWAPSPRLRANVEAFLLASLQEPEVVQQAVGELNDTEQSALRALLAANGVLAWERFVAQFGDEAPDRPWLEYHSENMKSVPGRLRARGLIFYGVIDGQESVVIPRELRPLIEDALAPHPLS